jgi:hypothetical protein
MMAFAEKQIAEKNIRIAPVNLFKGNKRLSAISVRLSAWDGVDNDSFYSDVRYQPVSGCLIISSPNDQLKGPLNEKCHLLE